MGFINGLVTWEKLAQALKDVIDGKTTLAEVLANADIADAIAKRHDGAAQDAAIAGKLDKPLGVATSGDLSPYGANTRQKGVVYQNTTGKPLQVTVLQDCATVQTQLLTGPTNVQGEMLLVSKFTDIDGAVTMTWIIPKDWFYVVVDCGGYIFRWYEQTLG